MESTFMNTTGTWGEGEVYSQSSAGPTQSEFEKLTIPVLLSDVVNSPIIDDKFRYGHYTFNTVRVCGQIVTINESDNGELVYTICDPEDENSSDAVVSGMIYPTVRKGSYAVGQWVVICAKLRIFGGDLNLLTFSAIPSENMSEIRALKTEARLAKFYYMDNGPEKVMSGVVPEYSGTALSNEAPQRVAKPEPLGSQFGGFNAPNSFPKSAPLTPIQPIGFGVKKETDERGLIGVRRAIVEYIEKRPANADTGIHIDELKRHTGNPSNFDQELQFLTNEGILFNTVDEHHFALI